MSVSGVLGSSFLGLGSRRKATGTGVPEICKPQEVAEVSNPAINLWFGDEASGARHTTTFRPPYATPNMGWVTFGIDDTLDAFIRENTNLIREPGLDGIPFAPHAGNGIYQTGLAVNCGGKGFLEALMSVVQDCRMEQFPWLKDALPKSTYKQLSVLQIPRMQQPRRMECVIDG